MINKSLLFKNGTGTASLGRLCKYLLLAHNEELHCRRIAVFEETVEELGREDVSIQHHRFNEGTSLLSDKNKLRQQMRAELRLSSFLLLP